MAISYGLVHKGYTLGRDSIIGLLQGGAHQRPWPDHDGRAFGYVKITTPLKISALKGSRWWCSRSSTLLLLPLVFAVYFYLLKKGPRYTTILLSIVAISIVCSLTGVL
jgi:D-glucosaminate-specific PTS system IID component